MKKLRIYAAVLSLALTVTATSIYAADKIPTKEQVAAMTTEQKEARLEEISNRVNEIKAMDKSNLSKAERKALRNELKDMKKESKVVSGGVYLSVGAIIIIILVLILIL